MSGRDWPSRRDTPGARQLGRLLAAPTFDQLKDWKTWNSADALAQERKGNVRRARGSLTQAQLRSAERFALKYGFALPLPTSPTARESQLGMVWADMQNAKVALPSVAGDALADAKKGTGTK